MASRSSNDGEGLTVMRAVAEASAGAKLSAPILNNKKK